MGASTLITMDGFAHLVDSNSDVQNIGIEDDFASFGAIHLNITNLEKSTSFYSKIVGMKVRKTENKTAELGTQDHTLVVLHETATSKFKKGYSGLYHFAIHAPSVAELAHMIHRLHVNKINYSPVDHTSSKSIYLDDPDGINVEFTLETPERLKRVNTSRGIIMEGTDGINRSASERLDVNAIMRSLEDKNTDRVLHNSSYLGHIHLYANNVNTSNSFYRTLGYIEANYLPQFKFADLGAGGVYNHRMVMNSWHGLNKPLAPEGSAGMKNFQINFKNKEKYALALAGVSGYDESKEGCWIVDPTGNKILLTNKV